MFNIPFFLFLIYRTCTYLYLNNLFLFIIINKKLSPVMFLVVCTCVFTLFFSCRFYLVTPTSNDLTQITIHCVTKVGYFGRLPFKPYTLKPPSETDLLFTFCCPSIILLLLFVRMYTFSYNSNIYFTVFGQTHSGAIAPVPCSKRFYFYSS